MLAVLATAIPAGTPWVNWPDFSGQLDNMFTDFIQPLIISLCVIVIAWMIIMTLVQQPDRTDIIWATLKALGVALVGWFLYNLDDFVTSVVETENQIVLLLPLLRALPLSVRWTPKATPPAAPAPDDADHMSRRS